MFRIDIYPPGNKESIEHGCTCPKDINCNGEGFNHTFMYVISDKCPIHCKKEMDNETTTS